MEADYVHHARNIGVQLLREAQHLPDGSLTWGRGANRAREPVLDSGPFNGRSGEALFFATLHDATGDPDFADAALLAIRGIQRALTGDLDPHLLARGLSHGLSGVGGIIYTLVRLGALLRREDLVSAAACLASLVTPSFLAGDRDLDVVWGSAGLLLSLLALADAGDHSALAKASHCASHLVANRVRDAETGCTVWKTLQAQPCTGFAHGTSGIAHALLRWSVVSGDDQAHKIAVEAFAFERDLYRADVQNWEDSKATPKGQPRMWSWCHGAPGIGLSRLALLGHADEREEQMLVQDLRWALRATTAARSPAVDTVCCGYFGRIDVLLESGLRLQNDSLVRQARRLADLRLARADLHGFLTIAASNQPSPLLGGFWQGIAGVGYVLLRLARPEAYPTALAMA